MTKDKEKTIYDVLHDIQINLNAPKNQYNKFGNYNYRSCEDIFEGLKKVLPEGASVQVDDSLVVMLDHVYVQATATLMYYGEIISNRGYAKEPLNKKGMDDAQITGATSSYARKYALNGLFLIDDVKDSDTKDNTDNKDKPKKEQDKKETSKEDYYNKIGNLAVAAIRNIKTSDALHEFWNVTRKEKIEELHQRAPATYRIVKGEYDKRLVYFANVPVDNDEIQY